MTNPVPEAPISLSENLAALLAQAGVGKDSVIRVTGPSGLAALLWFCRHGYEQVGYVRPGRCPGDDGDLLFAPQRCDTETLSRLLQQGPHVREGGLLIVQTAEPEAGAPDPAPGLLTRAGYRVEQCLHGRHREVLVARRMAPARPETAQREAA